MKNLSIITLLFLTSIIHAQNWKVFNKNYRYNYSLENENYTTVVIFADSIFVQGTDTVLSLNRIATPCDSCWFYYPEAGVANNDFMIDNQPQFLQRRIILSGTGYRFSDTSNYVIPKTFVVGDSWLFNASRGITAHVISTSLKTHLSVADSVKTILLSTADTIVVSKQFGIIKYPAHFGQQDYYMLRGIEDRAIYDVTALAGEKVPNYYDFSLLKPGIEIYYSHREANYGLWPNNTCDRHVYGLKTVQASSISGNVITNTFTDEVKGCNTGCGNVFTCNYNPAYYPSTYPSTTYTVSTPSGIIYNFGQDSVCNMYNNKLYKLPGSLGHPTIGYYVIKFGLTSNNVFYKTYGLSCFASHIQNSPVQSLQEGVVYYQSSQNSTVYYTKHNNNDGVFNCGETFVVGYGQTSSFFQFFEADRFYCTSAVIDGTDTIGDFYKTTNIVTGIEEEKQKLESLGYPNPTKDLFIINLSFENTSVNASLVILDAMGKQLFHQSIAAGSSSEVIDLKHLAEGIYFAEIKMPGYKRQFKIIKNE